jgi:hypothetical protein
VTFRASVRGSIHRSAALLVASLALVVAGGCASKLDDAARRGYDIAARIPTGIVVTAPYEGKYSDDSRLPSALRRLSDAVPRAKDRVHQRLGVDWPLPPTAVCVVDAETTPMKEWAYTSVEARSKPRAVVLLAAEELVSDTSDVEATLTHEFVHALHFRGTGAVNRPLWLEEGLARWVESASDDETERWILSHSLRFNGAGHDAPEIESLLSSERALDDGDERGQAISGTVFFFALERSRGREFVRRLVVRLLRDADWRAAMESECGRPFPDLLAEVASAYDAWKRTISPDVEALADATRRFAEGDRAAGLSDVDRFTSEGSRPALRPQAEFCRWRMQWTMGDLDAAIASIHAFRSNHPYDDLVYVSWFDELRILGQQGRRSEFEALARRLLRDATWRPEMSGWREWLHHALDDGGNARSGGVGPPTNDR